MGHATAPQIKIALDEWSSGALHQPVMAGPKTQGDGTNATSLRFNVCGESAAGGISASLEDGKGAVAAGGGSSDTHGEEDISGQSNVVLAAACSPAMLGGPEEGDAASATRFCASFAVASPGNNNPAVRFPPTVAVQIPSSGAESVAAADGDRGTPAMVIGVDTSSSTGSQFDGKETGHRNSEAHADKAAAEAASEGRKRRSTAPLRLIEEFNSLMGLEETERARQAMQILQSSVMSSSFQLPERAEVTPLPAAAAAAGTPQQLQCGAAAAVGTSAANLVYENMKVTLAQSS